MKRSMYHSLRIWFRYLTYFALGLITFAIFVVLAGRSTICHREDVTNYPDYCGFFGIGMFVVFIYYSTLVPALLAAIGAVSLMMELVRIGLRIAASRSRGSVPD